MNRLNVVVVRLAIILPVAMPFAFADVANAQKVKKLSYKQAWAQCKQEIGANVPNESTTTAARYSAGGACMTKYGYRLKRKT
jgi:prephenate dehydratase